MLPVGKISNYLTHYALTHPHTVNALINYGSLATVILTILYIAIEDHKHHEFEVEHLSPAVIAIFAYLINTGEIHQATTNFKIALAIGVVLTLAGAWAIGDLLIYPLLSLTVNPLKYLANILIPLLGYYMVVFPYTAYKKGQLKVFTRTLLKSYITNVINIITAVSSAFIISRFFPTTSPVCNLVVTITILIVLFKLIEKLPNKIQIITMLLLISTSIYLQPNPITSGAKMFVIDTILALLYLPYNMYKVAGEWVFHKQVPITQLTPGMILGEVIYIENGQVKRLKPNGFKGLIQAAQLKAKHYQGQIEIIASNTAEGLTEEQIQKLTQLANEGKIPPTITVTQSAPFVPILLAGYVLTLIYPNLGWNFVLWLKNLLELL